MESTLKNWVRVPNLFSNSYVLNFFEFLSMMVAKTTGTRRQAKKRISPVIELVADPEV
jgi:hypothetical protein